MTKWWREGEILVQKERGSKEEGKESHRRVKRDAEDRGAWDQSCLAQEGKLLITLLYIFSPSLCPEMTVGRVI